MKKFLYKEKMMKKFLVIFAAVIMILVNSAMAQAADITVNGDGSANYTTIRAAITAASDGDTIIVAAGTYHDDLSNSSGGIHDYRIEKSITLLGAQAGIATDGSTDRGGETILTSSLGLPYSITAPNVIMDGFMIGNSNANTGGRVIFGPDADGSALVNCIIQNTPSGSSGHGICVYPDATGILIENNTIYNTSWEGIRLDGEAIVSGNTITNISNKGIYVSPTFAI